MQTTLLTAFLQSKKRGRDGEDGEQAALSSSKKKQKTDAQEASSSNVDANPLQLLTVVSLFCGAGGIDLGFINAGFKIVFAADNDQDSIQTYRKNIGKNAKRCDVKSLRGDKLPACDVIIGGPPCQGFSVGGHMDSSDERNLLVWEFARLVGELQPRAFVMENVAALATHQKWHNVRERLMREFKDHGYEVNQLILNSRNYGVAQSRERVFFIGTAKHIDPISAIDPLDLCMHTVYDVLKDLPPPGKHPNVGACKAKVTLARNPDLRKSPYAGLLLNGGGRPVNLHAPINTLLASMGGNKTPVIDEQALRSGGPSWFEEHHQRLTSGEEVSSEEPPPYIRRLSVTEAALLQSFPLTFRFVGSQSSQFRQIGNAVPPKLAHSIAAATARVLRSDAAKK